MKDFIVYILRALPTMVGLIGCTAAGFAWLEHSVTEYEFYFWCFVTLAVVLLVSRITEAVLAAWGTEESE